MLCHERLLSRHGPTGVSPGASSGVLSLLDTLYGIFLCETRVQFVHLQYIQGPCEAPYSLITPSVFVRVCPCLSIPRSDRAGQGTHTAKPSPARSPFPSLIAQRGQV
jgi:hypothetical protein